MSGRKKGPGLFDGLAQREFWNLAFRNLRRNRRRSFATGVSLAVGYAALVLLGGYLTRIENLLEAGTVYLHHLGHVAVFRRGGLEGFDTRPSRFTLDPEVQAIIAKTLSNDKDIVFFGRVLRGTGLAGNGCKTSPFMAEGVEPALEDRIRHAPEVWRHASEIARFERGRPISEAPVDSGISLSTGLARILNKQKTLFEFESPPKAFVPDCGAPTLKQDLARDANLQLAAASFDGAFSAVDVDVTGLYTTGMAQTNDSMLIAPLAVLQRLYDTDGVTYVAAFLSDDEKAESVARRLEVTLRAAGADVDVHHFRQASFNELLVGVFGFLNTMGTVLGSVVAIVVVLSVSNSMTMNLLERTREIGTLRSLGFGRADVTVLFLLELFCLTAAGVVAGTLLTLGVVEAVRVADLSFQPPTLPTVIRFVLTPTWRRYVGVAALTFVLTLVTTWRLVRRRLRESVTDLLTWNS